MAKYEHFDDFPPPDYDDSDDNEPSPPPPQKQTQQPSPKQPKAKQSKASEAYKLKRLDSKQSNSSRDENLRPDLSLPPPSYADCEHIKGSSYNADQKGKGQGIEGKGRGQPQPPPPQEIGLVNRGYQPGPQGQTGFQGQPYVVTSQEQVNWPRLQFLRPMKGLQLIERKSFLGLDWGCFRTCIDCCKRKLLLYDEDSKYRGSSESPYFCNLCNDCLEVVRLEVPNGNHALQTMKRCQWCESCFPCCIFYICKDYAVMKILTNNRLETQQVIGSFDYSPRFCRHECCINGKYVIKDATGNRKFSVEKRCCLFWDICARNFGTFENCGNGACDVWLFGPSCDPVNMTNDWNIPVKVYRQGTKEHAATVRMMRRPCWYECFCCPKDRYYIEYVDENESDENKALILGSALAMDHYKLNGRMMNDSDLRIPEHLQGSVIPDTIGSSIRRF